MRALSLLRSLLVAAFALLLVPMTAIPAQAAAGTITGIAVDASGKPLENVYWELYTLEGGEWTTLQFGPKLTDGNGRFTYPAQVGGQYRVCFSDSYYGESSSAEFYWQPEVRHADRCWPNATSWQTAQTWTPTAATPSRTFTVTLPKQGLGMAPVDPFVLGSYQVDEPLTVVGQEGWRPTNATFSYQWMSQRDGSPTAAIPGATASTFVPTAAQAGAWVYASVTATLPGYKPAQLTTPVSKVGTAHVQPTTPLTITGTAAPGSTLTAAFGKPADTYSEISWFVDGVPQPRATTYDAASSTFPVAAAHSGARVEARLKIYLRDDEGYIDGSDTFQRAVAQVSGSRPAQALPPAATPSGRPTVGRVLSAPARVTADPNATLGYQWLRGSAPVRGATTKQYTVRAVDVNKRLQVRVTVTRPGWPTTFVTTSAGTVAKRALTVGRITAVGKAKVGQRLTARATGWRPGAIRFRYQWLRDGRVVRGATRATYLLRKADRRSVIRVRVTASKPSYLTVTKTSQGRKVTG
ncbi:hypothetical protein LRP67_20830 [Nocardioides sp. cx-169]|uniref:hypothetical protein n=1 Tax=Nocardioides sp. cx-169 TaxID=2899080 RepID=UPI001E402D1E|nr:hypothetical protein [Nocardioides sp. cx-169]MCD4536543.1 hypothetical protein [Nocardioides sp. cx-169]